MNLAVGPYLSTSHFTRSGTQGCGSDRNIFLDSNSQLLPVFVPAALALLWLEAWLDWGL